MGYRRTYPRVLSLPTVTPTSLLCEYAPQQVTANEGKDHLKEEEEPVAVVGSWVCGCVRARVRPFVVSVETALCLLACANGGAAADGQAPMTAGA